MQTTIRLYLIIKSSNKTTYKHAYHQCLASSSNVTAAHSDESQTKPHGHHQADARSPQAV